MKAKASVKELIQKADVLDSKHGSDTIRVWESYREQANLWRAISILQIPTSFIALIFAWFIWNNRSVTLNVPPKPLPGVYQIQEIPDSEFIDAATNFINLVATYQHRSARRQFTRAHELVISPFLEEFEKDFLITELKTIENTSRSQAFFIDPSQISIDRLGQIVKVSLIGDRMKIVAGKELDPIQTKFTITLRTIPRNDLNPYGIVIAGLAYENLKSDFDELKELNKLKAK